MAFIEKKDPVVLNIKLTTCGRQLLSTGSLGFNYFAVGDSETDYAFNTETGLIPFDSKILRPTDVNPSLLSFVPKNLTGDPYNVISNVPSAWYPVTNTAPLTGFFTNTGTTFIVDSNHVKQPDALVYMSGITGGTTLHLYKAPTYGTSGEEPAVGDLLLVKWTQNKNTIGYAISAATPTPYLIYQIATKVGTLAGNDLVVTVDRNLPNFSGYSSTALAGAMIYYNYINYSGTSIFNDFSTDYLDESVLAFLQNSQCPTVVFPFWNMSIIYTDEIAGVQLGNKTYKQFDTLAYGGFVSYIQNQSPVYKKLGVIHYTNQSPANVYGEGFYLTTPKLIIPTIMWHKSPTKTLGVTFTAYGDTKTLTGETRSLNTEYYDLADLYGNVVGKVFTDLKLFVIEDQELLFAMSYKSNRSWTLSDFIASIGGGGCIQPPEPTNIINVETITGITGFGSITTGGNSISGSTTLTEYGICYKEVASSTWLKQSVCGSLLNSYYSMTVAGLLGLTPYEYRAYVKSGLLGDSGITLTATTKSIPSVSTTIGTSGIYSIIGTGGNSIPFDVYSGVTHYATQYRVVGAPTWLYSPTPVSTAQLYVDNYPITITSLSPSTNYEYRAWMQVDSLDYNGITQIAQTLPPSVTCVLPTVSTTIISAIAQTTATGGGNVTSDGGATVTARGIAWSTTSTCPTTGSSCHTHDGSGTGVFISSLSGLVANTTYNVQAYAVNSVGISYGCNSGFTTQNLTPSIETRTGTNNTTCIVTGGESVISGGSVISSYGMQYKCNSSGSWCSSPAVACSGTIPPSGFIHTLAALTPNTCYDYRACMTIGATKYCGSCKSSKTSVATTTTTTTLPPIVINVNVSVDSPVCGFDGTYYLKLSNGAVVYSCPIYDPKTTSSSSSWSVPAGGTYCIDALSLQAYDDYCSPLTTIRDIMPSAFIYPGAVSPTTICVCIRTP